MSEDRKTLFTGSYDGRVMSWDEGSGEGTPLEEASHSNQVTQMVSSGAELISVGMDDSIRISNKASPKDISVLSSSGMPKGVGSSDDKTVVVATENHIQIIQGGKKVETLPVGYSATAIAINHQGTTVAIGAQVWKLSISSTITLMFL